MKRYFNTKTLVFVFMGFILNPGCSGGNKSSDKSFEDAVAVSKDSISISYTKADLYKLKWIQGKWKGMDGNNPFYEIYEMVNDSTLMITSYEWNGKDSSGSSIDLVSWQDGAYWLGKQRNWKVSSITDTAIKMIPVKASNDIEWRYKDSVSWDAILVSKKGTKNYHMQHFDPFKK